MKLFSKKEKEVMICNSCGAITALTEEVITKCDGCQNEGVFIVTKDDSKA